MNRARGNDDAELDLGNHDPDKPKIGHHWARRKADQVARDTMDVTKTLPETIDEAFGWDQKQAKRKQQLHYAGGTAGLSAGSRPYAVHVSSLYAGEGGMAGDRQSRPLHLVPPCYVIHRYTIYSSVSFYL